MGREIRRVPLNWQHPKTTRATLRGIEECFQPMRDTDFESAMRDWLDELSKWHAGGFAAIRDEHPDYGYREAEPYRAFCEYYGEAPDPKYYCPKWADDEAQAFAVYETVSEGTPVTPAFATKEELVEYLVANGDFWDQKRGEGGWRREAAEKFVASEWAPTFMVQSSDVATVIKAPRDGI